MANGLFYYDPDKWTAEDILKYVEGLGLKANKSQRMAYYEEDEVLDDWPIKGYLIKGYDISFEPPEEHPQFGPLGRVDCTHADSAMFSPAENKKLFTKLKRKFGMTREDRNKKNRIF